MSRINIKAFFKFCRVKIVKQAIDLVGKVVKIKVMPDSRYRLLYYK